MSKKRIAMVCGKLCEAPEGDYFVTCSFDENHVLLRSRMPYHIVKCVKQHPGHNKIQCPYDATEYIDIDKYDDHLLNCESRRSFVDEKYEAASLRESGRMCNLQQTPFHHAQGPEPKEEWGGSPSTEEYDYNEDLINDLTPVGRGVGRGRGRGRKEVPKKGMGRAEILKRIFDTYHENQASSLSSNSRSSSIDSGRQDISKGQFEDE